MVSVVIGDHLSCPVDEWRPAADQPLPDTHTQVTLRSFAHLHLLLLLWTCYAFYLSLTGYLSICAVGMASFIAKQMMGNQLSSVKGYHNSIRLDKTISHVRSAFKNMQILCQNLITGHAVRNCANRILCYFHNKLFSTVTTNREFRVFFLTSVLFQK